MTDTSDRRRAVELLQQLGLKEYEAKCYVALARLPSGTAKDVSQTSDVPRTRVYEAVHALESKGLVEVRHSSPQEFRAVPIHEAAQTLREEYVARTSDLVEAIEAVEPAATEPACEAPHEVWTLAGASAIATRTRELVSEADREVVLVVGSEAAFADDLFGALRSADDRGVDLRVGSCTAALADTLDEEVDGADVFVSQPAWLTRSPADPEDETAISRILLVDGTTLLVSTVGAPTPDQRADERAVFGRGFDNGLVAVVRRLIGTGLVAERSANASE